MTGRRFLVLHLPRIATDRIRQTEPELASLPVAAWDMQGNRRVLTGVDATGTTLHVGQALADNAKGTGGRAGGCPDESHCRPRRVQ